MPRYTTKHPPAGASTGTKKRKKVDDSGSSGIETDTDRILHRISEAQASNEAALRSEVSRLENVIRDMSTEQTRIKELLDRGLRVQHEQAKTIGEMKHVIESQRIQIVDMQQYSRRHCIKIFKSV